MTIIVLLIIVLQPESTAHVPKFFTYVIKSWYLQLCRG